MLEFRSTVDKNISTGIIRIHDNNDIMSIGEHCKDLFSISDKCEVIYDYHRVSVMVFNNISVISWRSVLLVEVTGEPGENRRSVANH